MQFLTNKSWYYQQLRNELLKAINDPLDDLHGDLEEYLGLFDLNRIPQQAFRDLYNNKAITQNQFERMSKLLNSPNKEGDEVNHYRHVEPNALKSHEALIRKKKGNAFGFVDELG